MNKEHSFIEDFMKNGYDYFLPGVSVDNVVFGFHDNQLKVLLLQLMNAKEWTLPGGYIYKEEGIDEAASRILRTRTGLDHIFLQQFHVFGDTERTREKILREALNNLGLNFEDHRWFLQRFVTAGYYALVEYEKVRPHPDEFSLACAWHDLDKLPDMFLDHGEIIRKALRALRLQLNYQPIGYNLLPREFTLKNLQSIYETILGRKLDRANFNRKILSYGILDKKEKHYTGAAHKAPYLYSFNKEAYFLALESGLEKDF